MLSVLKLTVVETGTASDRATQPLDMYQAMKLSHCCKLVTSVILHYWHAPPVRQAVKPLTRSSSQKTYAGMDAS
jgi:hypothetical protein